MSNSSFKEHIKPTFNNIFSFFLLLELIDESDSFNQSWVRVIEGRVHGIGINISLVLLKQFLESTLQFFASSHLKGILISLELKSSDHGQHEQISYKTDSREHENKQAKSDKNGHIIKTKTLENGRLSHKVSINVENGKDLSEGDNHVLNGMAHLPVSKFMAQNSLNLGRIKLLDEGVKQDYSLILSKSIEIGIGVGSSS